MGCLGASAVPPGSIDPDPGHSTHDAPYLHGSGSSLRRAVRLAGWVAGLGYVVRGVEESVVSPCTPNRKRRARERASDGRRGRLRARRTTGKATATAGHADRLRGAVRVVRSAVCVVWRHASPKLQSIKVEGGGGEEGRLLPYPTNQKSASERIRLLGALLKDGERKTQRNKQTKNENTDTNVFIRFRSRIYFPSQPSSKASRPLNLKSIQSVSSVV